MICHILAFQKMHLLSFIELVEKNNLGRWPVGVLIFVAYMPLGTHSLEFIPLNHL